jgi:hypothetical protein
MTNSQGEQNNFIEFLKKKADIQTEETVIIEKEIVKAKPKKEKVSLEKALREKIKEEKKSLADIEAVLVSGNQKIINAIRFDFFKDFSEKAKIDFKFFGRFISSRYLVPSLAAICIFILFFSVWVGVLRDKGYTYSALLDKVSESRNYGDLEVANERQEMENFILNNTKGRVAGVEASIEDEGKEQSKLMKSLSSLAKKQVQVSEFMNDKLIRVLKKN